MTEVPKPPKLARRGGVWFRCGPIQLHLGVEVEFHPALKAHPGLLVNDLPTLVRACVAAGFPTTKGALVEGFNRVYISDPFGNRLELLEALE
jgi:hypothetical protein